MSSMFKGCTNLEKLDLSNISTLLVTDMRSMFSDCSSLKELILSSFDTSIVYNMSYMFYKCVSLANLNLSNFTANKRNFDSVERMFGNCISLYSLDLSKFEFKGIKGKESMFDGCTTLKILKLPEGYNKEDYIKEPINLKAQNIEKTMNENDINKFKKEVNEKILDERKSLKDSSVIIEEEPIDIGNSQFGNNNGEDKDADDLVEGEIEKEFKNGGSPAAVNDQDEQNMLKHRCENMAQSNKKDEDEVTTNLIENKNVEKQNKNSEKKDGCCCCDCCHCKKCLIF